MGGGLPGVLYNGASQVGTGRKIQQLAYLFKRITVFDVNKSPFYAEHIFIFHRRIACQFFKDSVKVWFAEIALLG